MEKDRWSEVATRAKSEAESCIHLAPANLGAIFGHYELGHASIATTLNIYTHAVDASHRKAIEALERELFVVLDHSGLQTAAGLERAPPATHSIN